MSDSYERLRQHLDAPRPRMRPVEKHLAPAVKTDPPPSDWPTPAMADVERLLTRLPIRQRTIAALTAAESTRGLWPALPEAKWPEILATAIDAVHRWLADGAIFEELVAMDRGTWAVRRGSANAAAHARQAGDIETANRLEAACLAALAVSMAIATAINTATSESGERQVPARVLASEVILADPADASIETAGLAVQSAARAMMPHARVGEFLAEWWSRCRRRLAFVDAPTSHLE